MTYDSEPGLSDSPRGLLSPEKLILKMFIWISQRWVYTWTTRTKSTLLPSSDASSTRTRNGQTSICQIDEGPEILRSLPKRSKGCGKFKIHNKFGVKFQTRLQSKLGPNHNAHREQRKNILAKHNAHCKQNVVTHVKSYQLHAVYKWTNWSRRMRC